MAVLLLVFIAILIVLVAAVVHNGLERLLWMISAMFFGLSQAWRAAVHEFRSRYAAVMEGAPVSNYLSRGSRRPRIAR